MNERIKWFFVGGYVATFFFGLAGGIATGVLREVDRDLELIGTLLMLPAIPAMLVWMGSALWWVHDAWSWIPEEYHEVPALGRVLPSTAVALFFVPCFNAFWMFACNLGITSSLNAALAAQGSSERLSPALPVAAACLHFVPYCNFLFGPLVWFAYMYQADKLRAKLGRIDAYAIADVF